MQNENESLEGLARVFAGTEIGEGEIVYPDQLDRSKLDFSLESLDAVDDYLRIVHSRPAKRWGLFRLEPEESGPQWISTVLRGGAYVGEVIRRHVPGYEWITFEALLERYPQAGDIVGYREQLATCAVLYRGDRFTLPLNKILRFLRDGDEHSVQIYAQMELSGQEDVVTQNENEALEGLAGAFAGMEMGENEIVHPERLDRSKLDFSLESLDAVDDYLRFLHSLPEKDWGFYRDAPGYSGDEWVSTVLRGGAYVGEVIRRHSPKGYEWLTYEGLVNRHPQAVDLLGDGSQLGSSTVLFCEEGVSLPLNKILRFLRDGDEHSVRFYAQVELSNLGG